MFFGTEEWELDGILRFQNAEIKTKQKEHPTYQAMDILQALQLKLALQRMIYMDPQQLLALFPILMNFH